MPSPTPVSNTIRNILLPLSCSDSLKENLATLAIQTVVLVAIRYGVPQVPKLSLIPYLRPKITSPSLKDLSWCQRAFIQLTGGLRWYEKLYIKNCGDLNSPNANGVTPLSQAISEDDFEAVEFLRTHGANTTAPLPNPITHTMEMRLN